MTDGRSTHREGLFTVLVLAVAKPERVDEAEAAIRNQLERIRHNEPACVSIAVHRDTGDPDRLMLYELWTDRESFEVFLARDTMTEYLDQLDLLLETREISRWEVVG